MKKSTASRKVEWLQSEERLPCTLATATDTELKESDAFTDVEEDEDELEENELILEDCFFFFFFSKMFCNALYYAFYNP